MIPSYSLLSIAKLLLIVAFFFSGLFAAVFHASSFAGLKYERRSVSTESNISSKQSPIHDVEEEIRQRRRGFGLGTASDIAPSAIESLLGTVASLDTGHVSNLNSSVPTMSSSSIKSSGSVPFLITDQPILTLTIQSALTSSESAALTVALEGLLNGIDTLTTSSIVREAASEDKAIAPPIQVIAMGILSAENRVEANDLQALEAQYTVEGMFEGLNSAIDIIIGDITKDAVSDPLTPTSEGSSITMGSSLGNMAEMTDGPVSLVGNSIDNDICEITTVIGGVLSTIAVHCRGMTSGASIMLEASESTVFPVPTTSAPVSTAATSLTAVLATASSSGASQAITSPILTTRSVVGSISKGTVVGEDCPSTVTSTVLLAGETSTSTVYVYQTCPTSPPCPTCPPLTCHCPIAPPTATTSPLGGNGPQGPCPGSGYSCHDCIDGWFCPPPQTPALPAPCGFGWPCAHCYGGWFCVPHPTPTAPPDICESTGPNTDSPGSTSSTASLPSTPLSGATSPPRSTQPEGQMPGSMGTNSAPNGNGGPAPGRLTSSDTCDDGTLGPTTIPGSSPNRGPSVGSTSPRSNSGNTGLSGNRSPSNPDEGSGASPTISNGNPTSSSNGNTSPGPNGSAATNPGENPSSAPSGNGASSAANGGAGMNPTSGPNSSPSPNNGAETNPTASRGNSNSPIASPFSDGVSASPTGLNEGQWTTSAPNGGSGGPKSCVPGSDPNCVSVGNSGGQTQPSSGLGQETAGLNPNGNSAGNGGSPGQTSPGQDQGTAASNPTGNLSGNSGNTRRPSSDPGKGPTNPSNNGNNSGQTSVGEGQVTATPNHTGNPSQASSGQGQGQGQGTAAPVGNSASPSQTSPGMGQGTAGPNPTANPPANGGNSDQGTTVPNPTDNPSGLQSKTSPAQGQGTAGLGSGGAGSEQNQLTGSNPSAGTITCGPGSTDPSCASPNNGGETGSGGQGQGTQSNLGGNNGNSPTTLVSNPASNPSGNGGPTPDTQGSETPSNSNGGVGRSEVTGPGSNPNSNPTGTSHDSTLTGENGPITSNPNAGGTSSNSIDENPQTPSFTFPPGEGPYTNRPPPSIITLNSMIALTEPDGKEGPPTIMLHHSMSSHGEPLSTPDLEVEEQCGEEKARGSYRRPEGHGDKKIQEKGKALKNITDEKVTRLFTKE
ncbi:hypothetical protein K449DRAFT_429490 [Hypoxylon sp. EC38]|nr:hypothetical protein K449DRAFT_429490 [Hypoxylon sp. EC38]